jgi:hypothetical protein
MRIFNELIIIFIPTPLSMNCCLDHRYLQPKSDTWFLGFRYISFVMISYIAVNIIVVCVYNIVDQVWACVAELSHEFLTCISNIPSLSVCSHHVVDNNLFCILNFSFN